MTDPTTTYNQITTGTVRQPDGWHVTIRLDHTETGLTRTEISKLRFATEQEAEAFAVKLGPAMRAKVEEAQ